MPWAAEFIPLAVALDDMAAKLSEREQELRDSNHQLRELAQIQTDDVRSEIWSKVQPAA